MTGATRELAMFPLGSVLFPGLPLQLRVFEPRYVAMLSTVLRETDHEFGVVLIERGSEVRGGDARFGVGTVARIVSVEPSSGSILLLASGASRFEVVRWLQDDPFPRALVRELAAVEFDDSTPRRSARPRPWCVPPSPGRANSSSSLGLRISNCRLSRRSASGRSPASPR